MSNKTIEYRQNESVALDIIVEAIALTGFPEACPKHTSIKFREATYVVTISVDDKIMLTCEFMGKEKKHKALPTTSEANDVDEILDKKFGCKLSKTSVVKIKVECKHGTFHDTHEVSVTEIEGTGEEIKLNEDTLIPLNYNMKKKRLSGALVLKVLRVSTTAELTQFKLRSIPTECLYTAADLERLGIVSTILKNEGGFECPEWVNLLGSMGTLLKVAEPVAEVDPHAKFALTAAQVAFELFMKQKERDERVLELTQVMTNVYQMILDSDPVEKCRTLSKSINELIALTRECAYFISQYTKTGLFAQRAVVNAFSSADSIISNFEKQFLTLKGVFFTGIMISIGNTTVRILEKIEKIDANIDQLVDILTLPSLGRSWSKLDGCIEGTQELLLSKIYEWGTSCHDAVPNIFLLLGTPSTGKTTVAHSVASFLHERGRLGATVFFDSRHSNNCQNFFPSILQELSKSSNVIHDIVRKGLEENRKFVYDPPNRQMDFVESCLTQKISLLGPILIIIDGLDKCIDGEILLTPMLRLSSFFKLLITSQMQNDITTAFPPGTFQLDYMPFSKWTSQPSYIFGFLDILNQIRATLFQLHSCQYVSEQIYLKCHGFYELVQLVLEFIAMADDKIGANFIELLLAGRIPKYTQEAVEFIKRCFITLFESNDVATAVHPFVGQWKQELQVVAVRSLVEIGYVELEHNYFKIWNYFAVLKIDVVSVLNLHCSTSMCYFSLAVKASSFKPDCTSEALHCFLTCKYSYPPQAMKKENKLLLEYLVGKHQRECVHKPPPGQFSYVGDVPDASGAIHRHHHMLQAFAKWDCVVKRDLKSGLVYLTPPLQHSGLSTSAHKITLLKIFLEIRERFNITELDNVRVAVAIYRAVTEKGKDTLAQMQIKLEESKRAIEPYNESTNAADVQVVGSWFVKNMQGSTSFEALCLNFPIPTSERFYGDATKCHGIGFVNSLHPGDHIAILAESNKGFGIRTEVTLFTDPKEICPPAKAGRLKANK